MPLPLAALGKAAPNAEGALPCVSQGKLWTAAMGPARTGKGEQGTGKQNQQLKSPLKMWIQENHWRINQSLPIITSQAITELGMIYNRLKSWILGTCYGKAVRREFCMLAPGSGATSDAASAVLSFTEQTEQRLDVFPYSSQLPAII